MLLYTLNKHVHISVVIGIQQHYRPMFIFPVLTFYLSLIDNIVCL